MHIGCVNNLHSIIFEIDTKMSKIAEKRQTVFLTSVDPMNKEREHPDEVHFNAPRFALYKQKCWKTSNNCVLGCNQACSKERVSDISITTCTIHVQRMEEKSRRDIFGRH